MATAANGPDRPLPPDEAFALLGNEIRMNILQTLGEANEPLPYSELRDRVGVDDSGQFNYHLGKLVDHFIQQTDDRYELERAGERVIEAVLSGAITDTPELEPTRIDEACPYCGSPINVSFRQERVMFHCTECGGLFGESSRHDTEYGDLGQLTLPPAGLQNRSAVDVAGAAWVWGHLEVFAISCGVCPRCSAPVDRSITVCETHDLGDGICDACGDRYAAQVQVACTNCILDIEGLFGILLMTNIDLLAFLTAHGIYPLTTHEWVTSSYEEEILSTDPFEARFTYRIEDAILALTVGDDLSVIDVERRSETEPI